MPYAVTQPLSGIRKHGAQVALFGLSNADMNSTSDQAFVKIGRFNRYYLTQARIGGASISLTTAAGGVYTGAGKTGSVIVSAGASYAALTGPTIQTTTSLNTGATDIRNDANLYLSLTTAQGASATMEFFELWGVILD